MSGSDEEGDYTLDIDQVTLEDDARFQCQVSIYCYLSIMCSSSYNIYAGRRGARRGPGQVPVRGADGDGAARGPRHPRRGGRGQDPGGQGPQPRVRVQGGQARRRGTVQIIILSPNISSCERKNACSFKNQTSKTTNNTVVADPI